MEFTAEMIAGLINGKIVGDPQAKINNFAKIEEGKPGCISFLANDKYEHYLYTTESSIVLVNDSFEPREEVKATLIKVKDAREAVAQLLQIYESMKPKKTGISELAFIDPTATIGENVYLAPFVAVGAGAKIGDGCVLHPHVTIGPNVSIGKDTEIYSNAVIYHDCRVGERCILHAGCVIGADGFGFQPTEKGYDKIPQIGIAIIEDDVEVGANTCIDRAVMGATIVHSGVKLDNLVQIAHNDEVGSHTVMSAQVGIAGSTKIGKWCMFGGQVGIAGHATIADRVQCGAQSGIPNNVKKAGTQLMGTPGIEPRTWWKAQAIIKQLPELYAEINMLKRRLASLEEKK